MVKYIFVECPGCKAHLKLHEDLERAFCKHCGKNFIIPRESTPIQEVKDSRICPLCRGHKTIRCMGIENLEIKSGFKTYEIFVEGCYGDGKCQVFCFPETSEGYNNYCSHGKCAWCKGTGKKLFKLCPFCEGTGDCRFCLGSGRCKICYGRGEIRCKTCDGRGMIKNHGRRLRR